MIDNNFDNLIESLNITIDEDQQAYIDMLNDFDL